jgi:6-phosphogluconolactonase/glucosamine-6-phosphate isomerase/deaminase
MPLTCYTKIDMANDFEVNSEANEVAASAAAGEHLNAFLGENKKRPILLMISGGSAINLLNYVGQTNLGENLTVSVLDERFSDSPDVNNFLQLQKSEFYKDAFEAGASFFGTLPRKDETMEHLATRWENNLVNWKTANPDGLIAATFGMGVDGHTAGIFGYDDEKMFTGMFNVKDWVVAYDAGPDKKFHIRLTTTLTFIKQIDFGFAYVCGAEKKDMLEAIIAGHGNLNQFPALVWHDVGKMKIFTDIR